jgi:hypothetical protein
VHSILRRVCILGGPNNPSAAEAASSGDTFVLQVAKKREKGLSEPLWVLGPGEESAFSSGSLSNKHIPQPQKHADSG